MKEKMTQIGQEMKPELTAISEFMYHNPELGNVEYKSSKALVDFLKSHGFAVTQPVAGIETAFEAVFDSGNPGRKVAYLCEYDALPEVGHGCGHNMIGTMSAGAGVILSKVLEQGSIHVFGTPAEETDGAKVAMTNQGFFDDMDAAMMIHPASETAESGSTAAMEALQFDCLGKPSHAAGSPEKGINALNAVIHLFTGIDSLRQHVTDDVRLHGIITKGGVAANIVPEHAQAQFYVRAATKEGVAEVKQKVLNIAKAAELMTGATLTVSNYEQTYDDLKTNQPLSEAFNQNLRNLGITDIKPAFFERGSTDIGNVSNVCPTIHPYISISDTPLIGHTHEMANATITELAHERLVIGAIALAHTGYDVVNNKL
ncbi:MAG: M20 family metallopeptidase [Turicibacter sp.]|nr:M20 family metallopeptidase [Turicibacter sp.]